MDIKTWKTICQNSAGLSWYVRVSSDDAEGETRHEIPITDTADSGGLLIGSEPTCHIVLRAPAGPATVLSVTAAGNHILGEVKSGSVGFQGQGDFQSSPGQQFRFDGGPLVIGKFTVKISLAAAGGK